MTLKPKDRRSLEEILQSTSDVLFPADIGEAPVAIDSKDCDGDTPLHVIIRRGDQYAASLLIENGANIDAIGDMGETPLHVAIGRGDVHVVEALLKAGARTDIRSEFGETASEKAKKRGGVVEKALHENADT